MPAKVPNGAAYQNIGGVPYVYGIGQDEITAGQYVTFLNKVDPSGDNPVQPVTGTTLWQNSFSPVLNPFSGEINLVENAAPGTHYQLAASYWGDKPLVNGNLLDFAYFVNSLYNGTTVAVDNHQGKSPLGFPVHLQTRYVDLSTDISTGMYDLQDSSYPFFQRLDTSGYVIPSENEWVKAAYYSPFPTGNGTHYYYYPTVSNSPPTALQTGGSKPTVDSLGNVIQANLVPGVAYSNYNQSVNWQPPYDPEPATKDGNVGSVGEDHTPSPWLTYDQGGNAVEYTDTTAAPVSGAPNPRDLPVDVKVHGGIANAATYQLWLTATGTSDPYGQALGQTDTQGGARFGYLPGAAVGQGDSKLPGRVVLGARAAPDEHWARLPAGQSEHAGHLLHHQPHDGNQPGQRPFHIRIPRRQLQAAGQRRRHAGVWLPGYHHPHTVLHHRPQRGRCCVVKPPIRQRGNRLHGTSAQCRVHQLSALLQRANRCLCLFGCQCRCPVLHLPRLPVRRLCVVGKLA